MKTSFTYSHESLLLSCRDSWERYFGPPQGQWHDPRLRVALHEAAHAVIAVYLQEPLFHVAIYHDLAEHGRVLVGNLHKISQSLYPQVQKGVIGLAGLCMEVLVYHDMRLGPGGRHADVEGVINIIGGMVSANGEFMLTPLFGQVVGECARLVVHLSAVIEEFAIYLTQAREVDGATATRIIQETLASYGIE